MSTLDIVVAEEVRSEETTAMNPIPARMITTAMATTYPMIGRTVTWSYWQRSKTIKQTQVTDTS